MASHDKLDKRKAYWSALCRQKCPISRQKCISVESRDDAMIFKIRISSFLENFFALERFLKDLWSKLLKYLTVDLYGNEMEGTGLSVNHVKKLKFLYW